MLIKTLRLVLFLSQSAAFHGSLIKPLACNRPPCRLAHTAAHNCRLHWPGTPPHYTRRVSVPSWVPALSSPPFPTFVPKKDKLACIILLKCRRRSPCHVLPPTFESRCRAVGPAPTRRVSDGCLGGRAMLKKKLGIWSATLAAWIVSRGR